MNINELMRYGCVRINELLANHSTWKIGGPADALIEPYNERLSELINFLDSSRHPWLVIGAGSNLLFDDKGFRGVIIKLGRNLSKVEVVGNKAVCQAGVWMPHLARKLGVLGLSGLEHTVGIPGSLGGLVVMNGGSKRQFIGKNIEFVEVITTSGITQRILNAQCEFGYRTSVFQKCNLVIVEVGLILQPASPNEIRHRMLDILRERRLKFPLKKPSCGSVFISDPDSFNKNGPPGVLIEKIGLKGYRIGGAQVSDYHANFVINTGNATSSDILELVSLIQGKVHNLLGVNLKCEFCYISEKGQIRSF
jgi:UDP-N-acetylmuramate dehydrogenase